MHRVKIAEVTVGSVKDCAGRLVFEPQRSYEGGRAPTGRKILPHAVANILLHMFSARKASAHRAGVPPRFRLCRPFGAGRFLHAHPRLAPWAAFLRRFAAGFSSCGL